LSKSLVEQASSRLEPVFWRNSPVFSVSFLFRQNYLEVNLELWVGDLKTGSPTNKYFTGAQLMLSAIAE